MKEDLKLHRLIKERMKEFHISAAEIARRLNVSPLLLSNYIYDPFNLDKNRPSDYVISQVCELLGINVGVWCYKNKRISPKEMQPIEHIPRKHK
jgi:transcriptional regulator with XRE-family HTH domain